MKRALDVMRCGAYLAATILCITLTVQAIRGTTLKKLDAAIDEARKTTYTLNVAAAETGKAAIQERKYFGEELPRLGLKTEKTLDSANALIVSLQENSKSLEQNQNAITAQSVETLKAATEEIRNLRSVEDDAAKAIQDMDAVVADPQIKASLLNISKATDQTAVTMQHVAETSKDVQQEVHSITHPSAITKTFTWILKVGGAVGNWIHF